MEEDRPVETGDQGTPKRPPFKRIFLQWEILRIPYNLVLAVTVVAVGEPPLNHFFQSVFLLIAMTVCCFGANVCFLAGPAVECYIHWLGWRSLVVRWALFISGTAFAVVLATQAMKDLANPWGCCWH